jgi:hypothetical protein
VGYLVELVILVSLGLWAWTAWRRGAVGNLLLLPGLAVGGLLSSLLLKPTFDLLGRFGLPTSVKIALTLGLSSAVFGGLLWLVNRRLRSGEGCLQERLEARWQARPVWQDRAARGTWVGLYLATAGLLLLVGVNLFSLVLPVGERTLVLGSLVVERRAAREARERAPRDDAATSSIADGLLGPLENSWSRSRDFVADQTGVTGVVERLDALQALVDMPDYQRQWLAANDPALSSLIHSASLRAIFDDPQLVEALLQASQGSLTDLAKFLDHPKVTALADDEELRAAVRELDLLELQRRVREREERGFPLPLYWHQAPLLAPQGAQAAMHDPDAWFVADTPGYALAPLEGFGRAYGCLLAKAALVAHEDHELRLRLRVPPGATARINMAGQTLQLTSVGDWLLGRCRVSAGDDVGLLLLVDLRDAGERARADPAAFVELTAGPPK